MRVVVALGGNALMRRGEPLEASVQREHVAEAARSIAALAKHHSLLLTHGNGPQVGLLALQSESYRAVRPYPLDVLVAESEGMIGYLLEQALQNELSGRQVATVLTEVDVDLADPAFAHPTKPVGPVYTEGEAHRLATEHGWQVARDGAGYRRVVASPEPRRIVEMETIRRLVDTGAIVICAGGGGIPVFVDPASGRREGIEAVIDKDLSAALLAIQVEADFLMLLTDVDAVEEGWGGPGARPIRSATPARLRSLSFAAGSMAPKIEAACRFVEATGRRAGIGSLARASEILAGRSGTSIAPTEAQATAGTSYEAIS
ncbi:MAG TPA: carbamate kinase [Candidatus Dormibacteraeota bacterium]|nr:carbamate kinase [Candidatus Dormibacteraeota bacterium]